jgi:hypothetical protein
MNPIPPFLPSVTELLPPPPPPAEAAYIKILLALEVKVPEFGPTDQRAGFILFPPAVPVEAAIILPEESTVISAVVKVPPAGLIIFGIFYLSSYLN